VPGTAQDLLHGIIKEGFKPQLLDLVDLAIVRVGSVILVVIVQPEQGKHLVEGVDMALGRFGFSGVSPPSWCLRDLARGFYLSCGPFD
jgi:hypothetical protein